MPPDQVDYVETSTPGFVAQRIAARSSWTNARLRKRLGNAGNRNALPMGQTPAQPLAAGTAPPAITLSGRPVLGCFEILVQIVTAGPVGTATFQWSSDKGITWSTDNSAPATLTAPTVVLGSTGITAAFAPGNYSTDNVYAADTPVPRIVLDWIVSMVTWDVYDRRGVGSSQDPKIARAEASALRAETEVKEAADAKDGLFDIPSSEDGDSAQTTGDPLHYTEHSPYTSARLERHLGAREDNFHGTGPLATNTEVGDA